jgi:hypothetical protein
VTLAFEQLTLEKALTRFKPYARIVYQTRREGTVAPEGIHKIYVFPKTTATASGDPQDSGFSAARRGQHAPQHDLRRESSRAQPFRFEFDPSAVTEESK